MVRFRTSRAGRKAGVPPANELPHSNESGEALESDKPFDMGAMTDKSAIQPVQSGWTCQARCPNSDLKTVSMAARCNAQLLAAPLTFLKISTAYCCWCGTSMKAAFAPHAACFISVDT